MNIFDKNLLFEMSYALMRRFAFVEVTCPPDAAYQELLSGPGDVVRTLLPLRRFRDLGGGETMSARAASAGDPNLTCSQPMPWPPRRTGTASSAPFCSRGACAPPTTCWSHR